jgi:hypothetical protein
MNYDELSSGAMDAEYEATFGHNAGHVSRLEAARIADRIIEDERLTGGASSTTPLEPNPSGRSGVPEGYGKWGELA